MAINSTFSYQSLQKFFSFIAVISYDLYLSPSSLTIKALTKNIRGHDCVIFLQIYGLQWCREDHAEVNGLGEWLLFGIESGQTDVDENVCQSDFLVVISLMIMSTMDMLSN